MKNPLGYLVAAIFIIIILIIMWYIKTLNKFQKLEDTMEETDEIIKRILIEYYEELLLMYDILKKYKINDYEFNFDKERITALSGSINENQAVIIFNELKQEESKMADIYVKVCDDYTSEDAENNLEIRKRIDFLMDSYNENINEYKKCIEIYNAGLNIYLTGLVARMSGRQAIKISDNL